jgi:hypothetical protein
MNRLCALLLVAMVLIVPALVFADDAAPAPWRGAPNSVFAKFDLLSGPLPGPPAMFGYGGGYPLAPLPPLVTPPITTPAGELIYGIDLPNVIDPLPLKLIRIQYSWFGGTSFGGHADTIAIHPIPGGTVTHVGGVPPAILDPLAGILHRYDDFEIRPNPDAERFEVRFVMADPRWVIIDTISIPEPSSVALFAFGCFVLGSAVPRR